MKCPKHGSHLLHGTMETRFGFPPAPPDGYFEAQEELFPLAKSWEVGGCVIDIEAENETSVHYCPACRAAEKEWESGRDMEEFWRV